VTERQAAALGGGGSVGEAVVLGEGTLAVLRRMLGEEHVETRRTGGAVAARPGRGRRRHGDREALAARWAP